MRVTFFKLVEDRCSYWETVRGRRSRAPGTPMALGRGGMPHDLLQMLVEGTVGIDDGFWGSVAAGATFKSTGRKRTRPGRAVIAQNRFGIDRAEHVVGETFAATTRRQGRLPRRRRPSRGECDRSGPPRRKVRPAPLYVATPPNSGAVLAVGLCSLRGYALGIGMPGL